MNSSITQSFIADFKQRTRQQSYLITLLVMALATILFFPAPQASYQTLIVDGYRGIYNSAWLGICLAMLNVIFLPIICFYLVKNTINNDRQLLLSELIAATPVGKFTYLLCKWLVNVTVLTSIALSMLLTTALLQLYFGESYTIELWLLVWPQLIFVLPMLMAIAAVTLLFESISWLRGGFGNVTYFFIWVTSIVNTAEGATGISSIITQIEADIKRQFPNSVGNTNIGISASSPDDAVLTFVWQGAQLQYEHITGMLFILMIALLAFILAYLFFDRFQKIAPVNPPSSKSSFVSKQLTNIGKLFDALLINLTRHSSWPRQMRLEFLLLIKGLSSYWYLGLIGLNISQLFVSFEILTSIMIPGSWLFCVLVLSQVGVKARESNTLSLLGYCNLSAFKRLTSLLCAAFILISLSTFAATIRIMILGEWLVLAQILIGMSFSIALAYFCSTLTHTRRTFEVLYPVLWYIGPMQSALYVDYFGVNSRLSWQANMPIYSLLAAALLIVIASSKRHVFSHKMT